MCIRDSLGTEIQVSTLVGSEKLKIAEGTQPNTILKIKGKGLPKLHSSRRGDQFVRVVVEIPKKLSKEQKSFLKDFDQN